MAMLYPFACGRSATRMKQKRFPEPKAEAGAIATCDAGNSSANATPSGARGIASGGERRARKETLLNIRWERAMRSLHRHFDDVFL